MTSRIVCQSYGKQQKLLPNDGKAEDNSLLQTSFRCQRTVLLITHVKLFSVQFRYLLFLTSS